MTKLDETGANAINIIARLRRGPYHVFTDDLLWDEAADLIEALCAELARMAVDSEDLRSAIRLIEGLIDQQAMQDDWYAPELDRLKSAC